MVPLTLTIYNMKKSDMLNRLFIAVMVVVSTLLASCMKEDLSMCNRGMQIRCSYLLNPQGENLFEDEVSNITVFVFDAAGLYYGVFSDGGNHLTNDYVMTLPLSAGIYTIVAWGGDITPYDAVSVTSDNIEQSLTKGETTLEQFRLQLKEQELQEKLGLYYGIAEQVELRSGELNPVPIELIKNSNTVRVSITGLGNTSKADPTPQYDVMITAQNGTYTCDNTIPTATKVIRYKPHTTIETATKLTYDSNTLRLMIGQQPMLRVVNNLTGAEVCNFNLVEAIMKDPKYKTQKDLDREDLFQFDFRVNEDLSVSITINGWSVIDVIPEL